MGEQRSSYQRQIASIDLERETEAARARQHAESQRMLVANARVDAAAEMEDTLDRKRSVLQSGLDKERKRCEELRNRQLLRASEHRRDVQDCQKHINIIKDNYRNKPQGEELLPLHPVPMLCSRPPSSRGLPSARGGPSSLNSSMLPPASMASSMRPASRPGSSRHPLDVT